MGGSVRLIRPALIMTRLQFAFYSALLLSMALFSGALELSIVQQAVISGVLIAFIGIPHGAIDHILFQRKREISSVKFFVVYLALILLNVALWMTFPAVGFVCFILLSAYHFGQSQFSTLNIRKGKPLLYISWGISILAGLVLYNFESLVLLVESSPDVQALSFILNKSLLKLCTAISALIVLAIIMHAAIKGTILKERGLLEIFLFGLIHVAFFVLPLLIGFTLYFVVLHSLQVLGEEYTFLRSEDKQLNPLRFIKMLAPMTALSLVGAGLVVIGIENNIIQISYPLLFLLGLSAITLPHSMVMEIFYSKEKN